jgi:sterol 3beta-glucosyltransferase
MRISILALGSRGDIAPCIALGGALRAAGHRVRLATFEGFGPAVTAQGLDFTPVQGDPRALLAQSGSNQWAVFRAFSTLAEGYARDFSDPALREADIILNQLPGAVYGYDLAESAGVPIVELAVIPLTRTRAFPNMALQSPLARVPGYNRASYVIAEQLLWMIYRPILNRWRRATLSLPALPAQGYFGQLGTARVPVLDGFSAHVVPRPPDWGAHVHVTGYWFPAEGDWQPPEALVRFVEAGPPPVYVSFGSMPVPDPRAATLTVLDALRRSGQRAVLGLAWGGLDGSALPEHVFPIEYAPYDWLFPRMAALVHHGGSGTTAFGLRAGAPALIVPFLFDQSFWGRRLAALGVGLPPLPFARLTSERLAAALDTLVHDAGMRARAAALGAAIRAEDGLGEAVRLVTATESRLLEPKG